MDRETIIKISKFYYIERCFNRDEYFEMLTKLIQEYLLEKGNAEEKVTSAMPFIMKTGISNAVIPSILEYYFKQFQINTLHFNNQIIKIY